MAVADSTPATARAERNERRGPAANGSRRARRSVSQPSVPLSAERVVSGASPPVAAAAWPWPGRRSRPASVPAPRRAPGVMPSSWRMVSLNWRREPKPAAKATSTSGIELCVISARAVWTRRLRASWSGEAPIAAVKRRSRVRELTPRRWATPPIPPPSARPAAMSRSARPTSAPSGSSSRSGRQRLQARNPAASAAAGEGRKRTWSRRGVRDGHPMRQYTPVVVTATRNLPSKRRSRLATARYRLSKSSMGPWCGEGHGDRSRIPDRAVGGPPDPDSPLRSRLAHGGFQLEELVEHRVERLILSLEVPLNLLRLMEGRSRILECRLRALVGRLALDVLADDDDGEHHELDERLADPLHQKQRAICRVREHDQRQHGECIGAPHGSDHRRHGQPDLPVDPNLLVVGLGRPDLLPLLDARMTVVFKGDGHVGSPVVRPQSPVA